MITILHIVFVVHQVECSYRSYSDIPAGFQLPMEYVIKGTDQETLEHSWAYLALRQRRQLPPRFLN